MVSPPHWLFTWTWIYSITTDSSLFIWLHGGLILLILIYVDDIIVTENRGPAKQHLLIDLNRIFATKDLGPLHFFLGLYSWAKASIFGIFYTSPKWMVQNHWVLLQLVLDRVRSLYKSLAHTAAELAWIRMLLKDLSVFLNHPPVIFCDNINAIYLASNSVHHARTKHVKVDYHYVSKKVIQRDLQVSYVASVDQIADIFTKGLTSARFKILRSKLHVQKCRPTWGGVSANPNLNHSY